MSEVLPCGCNRLCRLFLEWTRDRCPIREGKDSESDIAGFFSPPRRNSGKVDLGHDLPVLVIDFACQHKLALEQLDRRREFTSSLAHDSEVIHGLRPD